ncbi:MAG: acyl-phosphate glycerol 3-phosphate acyltransferase [Confluentimicrobium sp.]|jgi:glycerol-3-phosphate acyltransferase PlsY|uniref:glycerol-3-phosphate 1-O-acyltransferase PlsY n=1 Tax=Actibacterium sp. TaxID=1872125 RepID=UPI000C6C1404|nr:glycerol-3-phosphate 1-O-acyltransferase PlsY [Actibacterium sp.]MBC58332.1 acyl-phosphate glycerol 3-phosphate acyltransferase [Actibacterium sp.]
MPDLVTPPLILALVALLAYLAGAVPFGIVIARIFGLGDLRRIGSGNIGATNVLRTGNKPAAFLTLVLDAGKGAFAVLIARAAVGEDAAQLAGLAAFTGHIFPVYLGFRGGKGVATFLGTLLALAWPVGLAACATWLIVALATRYSSLSALMAAALSPLYMIYLGHGQMVVLGIVLTVLIYARHWPNIERLKAGTEPKIGKG